ncbi:unnamed protein product [Arabidopsis lyrata]|nr:unnamed protein product [Arabidopsis lyrata]
MNLLMNGSKFVDKVTSTTKKSSAIRSKIEVRRTSWQSAINHLKRTKTGTTIHSPIMRKLRLTKHLIPRLDVISHQTA